MDNQTCQVAVKKTCFESCLDHHPGYDNEVADDKGWDSSQNVSFLHPLDAANSLWRLHCIQSMQEL